MVLIVVLLIFLDLHDDNLNRYEESQDPQPWVRIRLRRVRLPRVRLPRVRLPRVRISFQKLKCPAKCVAYSLCMAKTKGVGYLICRHIKKIPVFQYLPKVFQLGFCSYPMQKRVLRT